MRRIAWASLLVLGSTAVALEELACKQVSVASLDPDGGPDAAPAPPGPDAGEDAATTSVAEAGGPTCGEAVVQAGFDDLDGGVTADFASAVVNVMDGGLTVTAAQSHDGAGSLRVIPNGYAFLEVPIEVPLAPGDHCVQLTFFARLEHPPTSPVYGPGIAVRGPSGPSDVVQVEIAPGDVPSLFVVQTSHGTVSQTDNVGHFEDGQWHKVRITTTTTGTTPGKVQVFLDELPPLGTPLAVDLTARDGDAGATSLVAWLGITNGSSQTELYLDDVAIDVGH